MWGKEAPRLIEERGKVGTAWDIVQTIRAILIHFLTFVLAQTENGKGCPHITRASHKATATFRRACKGSSERATRRFAIALLRSRGSGRESRSGLESIHLQKPGCLQSLSVAGNLGGGDSERKRLRASQVDTVTVCVSLFYVNDIGSTGSRGRTRGIPCIYPSP